MWAPLLVENCIRVCPREFMGNFSLRNIITEEAVVEFILRITIISEYDTGGKRIGSVVYSHSRNICQNLPCYEISLSVIENCFCRKNIVVTVLGDLIPHIFGNGLVPRKSQLLMMYSKLDLELFQGLFLTGKVIHIGV